MDIKSRIRNAVAHIHLCSVVNQSSVLIFQYQCERIRRPDIHHMKLYGRWHILPKTTGQVIQYFDVMPLVNQQISNM